MKRLMSIILTGMMMFTLVTTSSAASIDVEDVHSEAVITHADVHSINLELPIISTAAATTCPKCKKSGTMDAIYYTEFLVTHVKSCKHGKSGYVDVYDRYEKYRDDYCQACGYSKTTLTGTLDSYKKCKPLSYGDIWLT